MKRTKVSTRLEYNNLLVITSYSIHYTKLYEENKKKSAVFIPEVGKIPPQAPEAEEALLGIILLDFNVIDDVVITSYSIHYTKLYERRTRGWVCSCTPTIMTVSCL